MQHFTIGTAIAMQDLSTDLTAATVKYGFLTVYNTERPLAGSFKKSAINLKKNAIDEYSKYKESPKKYLHDLKDSALSGAKVVGKYAANFSVAQAKKDLVHLKDKATQTATSVKSNVTRAPHVLFVQTNGTMLDLTQLLFDTICAIDSVTADEVQEQINQVYSKVAKRDKDLYASLTLGKLMEIDDHLKFMESDHDLVIKRHASETCDECDE